MSDFDRVLELAGVVAVLRYYLGAACDYAEGDHVPPAEVVARWRELADELEAGGKAGPSPAGEGLHHV